MKKKLLKKLNRSGRPDSAAVYNYASGGSRGVFRWHTESYKDELLYVVSAPPVIVSALVLAVSACVGYAREALLMLLLLLVYLPLLAYIRFLNAREFSAMNSSLVPDAVTEEEGCVCPGSLLPGQLLSLHPGDVVAADADVVTSFNFRVLEHYTDPESGKRVSRAVEKHEPYNIAVPGGDTSDISPTRVLAGSTVLSGRATASVVAEPDSASAAAAGGIRIAPEDNRPSYVKKHVSGLSLLSVLILAGAVPVVIISLVLAIDSGKGIIPVFPVMLSAVALSVVFPGERMSPFFESIASGELCDSTTVSESGRSGILQPSADDILAVADTAVILCDSVLYDSRTLIRSVYYSGSSYSGEELRDPDLREIASALLLLHVAAEALGCRSAADDLSDGFAEALGTDREALAKSAADIRPYRGPQPGDAGVYVTFSGETLKIRRYIRTERADLCSFRYLRDRDGNSRPIDSEESDALRSFMREAQAAERTLVTVYSEGSGTEAQKILEGVLSVGEEYPDCSYEVISAMADYGIRTVLVIPEETGAGIAVAVNSGIAPTPEAVCLASRYKDPLKAIREEAFTSAAFCGFGREGSAALLSALYHSGANIICVAGHVPDMRIIPDRRSAVCVTGCSDGAVRLGSTAAVAPAGENCKSGLNALFSCVMNSAAAKLKCLLLNSCFAFLAAFLITSVLLPFAIGRVELIPSGVLIMYAGVLSVLGITAVVSEDTLIPPSSAETAQRCSKTSALTDTAVRACTGFLSGLAFTLCSLLIYAGTPDALYAFQFGGLLITPCAVLTAVRFSYADAGRSGMCIVQAVLDLICAAVVLLNIFAPAQSAFLTPVTGFGCRTLSLMWSMLIPGAAGAVATLLYMYARRALNPENSGKQL